MTKLILLEGLPGSGKSTFARFVSMQLERNGFQTKLFHETAYDHPLFLSGVSYPNPSDWMLALLDRWKMFIEDLLSINSTVVLESAYFQYPILNLLHQDVERSNIISFIQQIADELAILDTTLIYFYQDDQLKAIHKMIEKRGGQDFLLKKYQEHQHNLYYLNRLQSGPELHIQFLTEYGEVANQAFASHSFKKIAIETTKEDWNAAEQTLLNFFDINYIPDPIIEQEELFKFVGVYRNEEMRLTLNIEHIDGYLVIFGNRKLRPKSSDTFYVDDISVEVKFITESNDQVKSFMIGEKDIYANRKEEGTSFVRVP